MPESCATDGKTISGMICFFKRLLLRFLPMLFLDFDLRLMIEPTLYTRILAFPVSGLRALRGEVLEMQMLLEAFSLPVELMRFDLQPSSFHSLYEPSEVTMHLMRQWLRMFSEIEAVSIFET